MRIIFLSIVLFSICQVGNCQIERPNKAYGEFTTEVTLLDSVDYKYEYVIKNSEESEQVLESFSIYHKDDAFDNPNKTIDGPNDRKWYIDGTTISNTISGSASGKYLDLPAENGLEPGEEMEISFVSKGLPAIKPFYTEGFVRPFTRELIDSLFKAGYTEDEIFIDWKEAAYKGYTISPRVWADSVDLNTFLNKLKSYRSRSCKEFKWVTNHGICNSLQAKMRNVAKQLGKDKIKQAINGLNAFLNEVEAQRGKHITSEGYALLYFNGQYLKEQLEEQSRGGKGRENKGKNKNRNK